MKYESGLDVPKPKPTNDDIVIYTRRPAIWGATCVVTGNRIPPFKMAYKKRVGCYHHGEFVAGVVWVSEAGYIIEKLKGHV